MKVTLTGEPFLSGAWVGISSVPRNHCRNPWTDAHCKASFSLQQMKCAQSIITLAHTCVECLMERKKRKGDGGKVAVMPYLMPCKMMHTTDLNSDTNVHT